MVFDNIILFLNVLEQFAIRVTIFDIDVEDIIKYVNKLYFNNNDDNYTDNLAFCHNNFQKYLFRYHKSYLILRKCENLSNIRLKKLCFNFQLKKFYKSYVFNFILFIKN